MIRLAYWSVADGQSDIRRRDGRTDILRWNNPCYE